LGSTFLSGIVEGFYGREWSWELRRDYASFLHTLGLNTYLYCPKSDPFLRKRWRENWPENTRRSLGQLGEAYRQRDLWWGVGLSPFALYLDYSRPQRAWLKARIGEINDLGGSLLAVLFDDMPGDCPDIATRQGEIVADIRAWSSADRLLVCPTYYSFDPVLERYFGPMPARYWETLGAVLAPEIDIFWTGNAVCSATIDLADIRRIAAHLGRPPVLWDNYPVNDGEQGCKFLNLRPPSGREQAIGREIRGHLCNPMNQGYLSRFPIAGLAALYGHAPARLREIFSTGLADLLDRDMDRFQEVGLDGLTPEERSRLASEYAALGEPAAVEVAAWLRGEYTFDPACLTG
jgi:hypothetical protein